MPCLREKVVAWTLFAVFLLLYVLTFSQVHTYDGLQYAISVESERVPQLFHPHHLLYNVLSYIIWKPLTLFDASLRSITVMGFISALAAAGGLALIWRFWRRSSVPFLPSLGGVIWLGLSYGWWSYAAEVEVYLPACFFMALALDRAVLAATNTRGRYIWQLGLAVALMVLFTQSAAIYWLGFALWMWKEREGRWSRLWRFAIVSILPISLVYLVAAWLMVGLSPRDVCLWLTAYAQMGQWGNWIPGWFTTSLSGIFTTVLAIPPFATNPAIIQGVAGPQWIVWAYLGGMTLLVAGALWGWSLQLHGWRGATVPLWLMIIAHFIFFAWWQPANVEFWIILVLLLTTAGVWGYSRLPRVWRNIAAALILAMGITGGIVNYTLFIGPRTNQENDVDLKAVHKISSIVTRDDGFLLAQDKFEKTLRYWGDYKNAMTMSELTMGGEHPDWFRVLQALKSWQDKLESQGHRLYVLGNIVREGNLMEDARSGAKYAQMVYEMLTSQATHVADVTTTDNTFELIALDRKKVPSFVLDVLQVEWPPNTAQPLDDGVGFFENFSAKQLVRIGERGKYELKVRGRGSSIAGQGAILVLKMEDRPIGQLEFGEHNWTTKSLPPLEFTAGWHVLTLEYVNDVYDEKSGKGRDLFLSTIQFIPVDARP